MKNIVVLCLFVFVCSNWALAKNNKDSKTIEITSTTYKRTISKGVILVDFWATWCAPCRKMSLILDEIASNNTTFKVGKIDVEENTTLAESMRIQRIPTMILFKDGKEISRFVGLYSKEELLSDIETALK